MDKTPSSIAMTLQIGEKGFFPLFLLLANYNALVLRLKLESNYDDLCSYSLMFVLSMLYLA